MIILVDELDRCLPEYAIRVLERLHHLFEGIENVQVIFAVDRGQLEHVVKQLYGSKTETRAYLRKFISFELTLEPGFLEAGLDIKFDARFRSYVSLFAPCPEDQKEFLAEFKARILSSFDIRHRIALVERAELVHRLIWEGDEPPAYFILCIELMLTVLHTAPPDALKTAHLHFGDDHKYLEALKPLIPGFCWLDVYIRDSIAKGGDYLCSVSQDVPEFNLNSIPGIMLAVLQMVLEWEVHYTDSSSLLHDPEQFFGYVMNFRNQLIGMN